MPEGLSVREFARREKCSHPLVLRAIRKGQLKPDADGKLDAAFVGTEWREGNRRKAPVPEFIVEQSEPQPHGGALKRNRKLADDDDESGSDLPVSASAAQLRFKSFAEAERVKEGYMALLKEHEYNVKTGLVVPIENVDEIVSAQYSAVRTRLLALPTELAPRVKRSKTVAEVQAVLLEAVTEALEEISSGNLAGAVQGGA